MMSKPQKYCVVVVLLSEDFILEMLKVYIKEVNIVGYQKSKTIPLIGAWFCSQIMIVRKKMRFKIFSN